MSLSVEKSLESLVSKVASALPAVDVEWDIPSDSENMWHVDLAFEGRCINLQWRKHFGFGISFGDEHCYGDGPEQVFGDEQSALESICRYLTPIPSRFSVRESAEVLVASEQKGHGAEARTSQSEIRFALTVIRAIDLERSAKFYSALGLNLTKHSHGRGPVHYAYEACGHTFEIYPAPEAEITTASIRIGFSVPSVDDLMDVVERAGGAVKSTPRDSEWGRRAVVTDPDGYIVELTAVS